MLSLFSCQLCIKIDTQCLDFGTCHQNRKTMIVLLEDPPCMCQHQHVPDHNRIENIQITPASSPLLLDSRTKVIPHRWSHAFTDTLYQYPRVLLKIGKWSYCPCSRYCTCGVPVQHCLRVAFTLAFQLVLFPINAIGWARDKICRVRVPTSAQFQTRQDPFLTYEKPWPGTTRFRKFSCILLLLVINTRSYQCPNM
jgi:hypothetical protein